MRSAAQRLSPPASPFLKWVGGKGGLLGQLAPHLAPLVAPGRDYHEPFLGGGAVFFELSPLVEARGGRAFLGDTNADLVNVWQTVQREVDTLVQALRSPVLRYEERAYYAIREAVPSGAVERAARFVYLNKCGYNGLYRVNSKGGFNVPFGRYVKPNICDQETLRAASAALQRATLSVEGFEASARARPGDLVYFDPPYDPLTATANFTSYTKKGFTQADQRRLCEHAASLRDRGVNVALSNSRTSFIEELYAGAGFELVTVRARRAINSRAAARGAIDELLALGKARR